MVTLKKCGERMLFYSGKKLIVSSDDGIEIVELPEKRLPKHEKNNMKENLDTNISCLCVSKNYKYIAVSTEDKQLVIFKEDLDIVNNFVIPRVASQMCFTSANSLIVADKTGDVFSYDFKAEILSPILLLGHLSVVLDLALTDCEKYIVTCDRDEKIRVTQFPNSYNIQSFCLGHEEFVSAVTTVENSLISASGDGTIRFWNYLRGDQLGILNTNDYIDQEEIKKFREEMNSQDVEVFSLPITDMQCFPSDGNIFIGISLFQYTKLLLFSVSPTTWKVNYCKHVYVGRSFSFYLGCELIILTASQILYLKLRNGSFREDESKIININDVHDLHLKSDQNISLLYKKKFDNVEEYIERKRARLKLK